MLESDLRLLRCPQCKADLSKLEPSRVSADGEVEEGRILCRCGAAYAIRDGIPHFVDDQAYTGSFGWQWKRWPRVQFDSENVGTPMEGFTSRRFFHVTEVEPAWIHGKCILEVGCGPGRFLDVVERHGGRAVGLELSEAANVARSNLRGRNVLVVRGDALTPPFRDGVFDGAYSIGVLHHTPAPESAFRAMVRTVKQGGRVSAHVYSRYDGYFIKQTEVYRKLFSVLGWRALLAYSYFSAGVAYYLAKIPLLRVAVRLVFPFKTPPSFRWRLLNIFDWLSPTHMSYHGTREVYEWFRNAGCREIEPGHEGPTTFTALAPGEPAAQG
jgi:SAM-dependent methyltransferase